MKLPWNLSELHAVPKNGLKVATTFSCGGGSSMGYKLAGYDVVLANDIDPEMAWHYNHNLKPANYILGSIEKLKTCDVPDECMSLDILDGSPPCSTFSMAGSREDAWGKKKKFREGQQEQVLSELFFEFIDVAARLKPKCVVAENVTGMMRGNAKGYVKEIVRRFGAIGYSCQVFQINAVSCGVPQSRMRLFFVANRLGKRISLNPTSSAVSASMACAGVNNSEEGLSFGRRQFGSVHQKLWHITKPGDSYSVAAGGSYFNYYRLDGNVPSPTLNAASHSFAHWSEQRTLTFSEYKRLGAFPDDYYAKTEELGKYIVGMSVPPPVTRYIAEQINAQVLRA